MSQDELSAAVAVRSAALAPRREPGWVPRSQAQAVPRALLHAGRLQLPTTATPAAPRRHARVVTTGADGAHGQPGAQGAGGFAAGARGEDGELGARGEDAMHALEIGASLAVDEAAGEVALRTADGGREGFRLGDPETSMFLQSRGGRGGDGGAGGAGGPGAMGYPGMNATRYSSGTNGGPGGNGGDGARGGDGGFGGNGADCTLAVSWVDADALMLLKTRPETQEGRGGDGGPGGAAGAGGMGGIGGASYSWSETVSSYDSSSGSYTYSTVTHSNPGGWPGPPGLPGLEGEKGRAGAPGIPGDFKIVVDETVEYPWRYDLEICGHPEVLDSNLYGVFEPGARCSVSYSCWNVGGMPTPRHQDVICTLDETPFMFPLREPDSRGAGSVLLPRSIPADRSLVPLPSPVHFILHDVQEAKLGAAMVLRTSARHRATVTRVNQAFPTISDQETEVVISHAVEISTVFGDVCVQTGREALLFVKVHNVSNKPLGYEAPLCRGARVRCRALGDDSDAVESGSVYVGDALELAGHVQDAAILPPLWYRIANVAGDARQARFFSPSSGSAQAVHLLNPGESMVIATTMCTNFAEYEGDVEKAFAHAQASVESVLDLGHPQRLVDLRAVQRRPFQVQFAVPFRYAVNVTKVLLVCNNRSTHTEILQWRALLTSTLGLSHEETSIALWNVSLYGGFSLKHRPRVGFDEGCKSLAELFSGQDQLVVMLNNLCSPTGIRANCSSEECAMPYLQHQELLHAARDLGCRFYIIGSESGAFLRSRLHVPVDASTVAEYESPHILAEKVLHTLRPNSSIIQFAPDQVTDTEREAFPAWMRSSLKGVLLKQKLGKKTFVKRVFVLRSGAECPPHTLSLYKDVNSRCPKRVYQLAECEIFEPGSDAESNGSDNKSQSVLVLRTPERDVCMKALGNDVEALEAWRSHLIREIACAKEVPARVKSTYEINTDVVPSKDDENGFSNGCKEAAVIQVVSRRLGVGEQGLKKECEKLAEKIQMMYPEARFLFVYKHKPRNEQDVNFGVALNRRNLGEIHVHLGLVDNEKAVTTYFVGKGDVAAASSAVHRVTLEDGNRYGLLKSLSSSEKLRILRTSTQEGSLSDREGASSDLRFLIDAILSDAAEENSRFRYGTLSARSKISRLFRRSKLRSDVCEWSERLTVLSSIADLTNFDDVADQSPKFFELCRLAVHLRLLVQRSLKKRESSLKLSRAALVMRASMPHIQRLEKNIAEAAGIESADSLLTETGQTISEVVALKRRNGLEDGDGRMDRHHVLSTFRHRFGVHTDLAVGEFKPTVIPYSEYEEVCAAAESSKSPSIQEERGQFGSDKLRDETASGLANSIVPEW